MSAPKAALWKNLPAHVRPPPDAIPKEAKELNLVLLAE